MIFNSLDFVVFFSIFFILYWFVANKSYKFQNILLLLGSYVFYSWVDWKLLVILVGISALNFYLGIKIEQAKNDKHKKLLTFIGLLQGIGGLVYFKYFNFFIESFNELFQVLKFNFSLETQYILIPLGISFFTFKTISYLLDVNRGKIVATKDWLVFFNYVSFFPTLIAGPIDKARTFIPQLETKRSFSYENASNAMRQILWGLFKKLVIADSIAKVTTIVFDNSEGLNGSTLLIGVFLYYIQIYSDFSGYSDMAIGFGRLIGFDVTKNFDFPLFSQNIADFWRKWHISLTSWVTEYVFTPLSISFRDYGNAGLIFAIILNFLIIGIWHGANWTYVLFGLIHGLLFIPLIINGTMNKRVKISKNKLFPSLRESLNIFQTFILVMFTLIIFRAESTGSAFNYISRIFSSTLFSIPYIDELNTVILFPKTIIITVGALLLIEWYGKENEFAIQKIGIKWPITLRWSFYFLITMTILLFSGEKSEFIYAQF